MRLHDVDTQPGATVRRILIRGSLGNAALLAASVGIVALVTAPRTPHGQGPAEAPAPSAGVSPALVAVTDRPAIAPTPAPAAAPVRARAELIAARTAPHVAAQAVVPRAAPHRLPRGSAAPVDLFAGLQALQQRVATCSHGAEPAPRRTGATSPRHSASFLLDLESLDGKVRIADAVVQRTSGVTEEAVACAQSTLVGEEISVKRSQPGLRFQLPFDATL